MVFDGIIGLSIVRQLNAQQLLNFSVAAHNSGEYYA